METNDCTIYQHRRLDNNQVFYIGIAKLSKRPYNKVDRGSHWKNIVNKAGYAVEIVLENITWEKACELEINLISYYVRKDLGLGNLINKTNGGEGTIGFKHTEETKKRMSEVSKGREFSKETLKKLSEAKKGDKNVLYGKKMYPETIRKRAEAVTNVILNTETGIFYFGIQEAADSIGRCYSYLSSRLNPNGKYLNDTPFVKTK